MSKKMENVYVVAMGRSAIAKGGKKSALRNYHPVTLAGLVLKAVLEKVPQVKADDIDDVVVGCATPERQQGMNVAKLITYRAGLPVSVPAMTVNRFCSSGIQSIATAAAQIECGQADCIVAGGVELMTAVRHKAEPSDLDTWVYKNKKEFYLPMGVTAENVAKECGVSREEMDCFSVESHRRAASAIDAGKFKDEIIPLPGVDADGNEIVFDTDQGVRRDTTLEGLAGLTSPFDENGVVTAGSSSQVSDGASFVVLMSGEKVKELNIKPIAKIGKSISIFRT
jgi:acetyl-CoA acyltransferase